MYNVLVLSMGVIVMTVCTVHVFFVMEVIVPVIEYH